MSESITVNPSGVDTTSGHYQYSTASNTANGYTDTSSTTYSTMNAKTGSRVQSYRYYKFSLSSIPSNATNFSVTAKVKACVDNTSYLPTAIAQLATGTTLKGSSVSVASTTATAKDITNTGTWTYSELQDARIYISATRGTSNTSKTARYYFYGAEFTVTYDVDGDKLMIKIGGTWTEASKVYKKISGSWVEQSDLTQVFDSETNYKVN